jgi:alkyl sulfatase BDS1-like metallo-beta-lactamase superfamily hydrolase
VSAGAMGLIGPTRIVEDDIEEFQVDGVWMVHQNTPRTEAPSEMNTYIPEMKALWMAENVTSTLHNIYTLRGAPVRDPLRWSKYISEALFKFGLDAEVMFASHHWPRWGNERVQEVLRGQRDLYAHMNNQVLHLANQGVTINQIHNEYELPKSILENWFCRGYHGSPEHNSRGVVQRYLGFWDCNPATLIPLSPEDSAPLYVEMMGGANKIITKGQELHDEGKYMHAQEIVNKLVQADPRNQAAKDLLADIFEQLGYQQENPGLRNSYLAAAYELRSGIPQGEAVDSSSPDVIRAMTTELFLNFLGIRMDSRKAEGMRFTINLITPDNGEKFLIEMENATLTNIEGYLAEKPDLAITINRSDLEQTMMGAKTLDAQIADGTAKIKGDANVLKKLASTMVEFDPRFEIMPGTHPDKTKIAKHDAFEAIPGATVVE